MSDLEQEVRDFFDPAAQGKSMLGHAALVLALEAVFALLAVGISWLLEASIFAPGLMAFGGAFCGFVGGMVLYGPREYRSIRQGIEDRDWTLVVYSLGDWLAPLLAGLAGLWLLTRIISFG